MGKLLVLAACLLLFSPLASPFVLTDSREEMISYYQTAVEPKIPKTAKALLGDERINIEVGGKTLGIITKRGELYGFDMKALENPSIEVFVSDRAAEEIRMKRAGVLQSIDNGGITVHAKGFYTKLKLEVMKRIYAISGADDILTGKRKAPGTANSIYVQRARIAG